MCISIHKQHTYLAAQRFLILANVCWTKLKWEHSTNGPATTHTLLECVGLMRHSVSSYISTIRTRAAWTNDKWWWYIHSGARDHLHIVQQLSTSVINYTLSLIQLSGRQMALWQGKQSEIKVSLNAKSTSRGWTTKNMSPIALCGFSRAVPTDDDDDVLDDDDTRIIIWLTFSAFVDMIGYW